MILLTDGTLALSASDLTAAASCEFAVARRLDVLLGRAESTATTPDAMLDRVVNLGTRHEHEVLDTHVAHFGWWDEAHGTGVATISRPDGADYRSRAAWELVQARTLATIAAGADVVYQAGFFDGRFIGWADFLLRADDGTWTVADTKLARSAKVEALIQLAAYADQLERAGIAVSPDAVLVLGDGAESRHPLVDLLPVYRERRRLLEEFVDAHRADTTPAPWRAPHLRACGRCDVCVAEARAHRDVLLVAGLRGNQRIKLAGAGITTIDDLAGSTGAIAAMGAATLEALRRQARLQVAQEKQRAEGPDPDLVTFEIIDADAINRLPAPDPGDIFFDFEGDPMWLDTTAPGRADAWGVEYLFGVLEAPVNGEAPVFRAFWAHDRAQEKQALIDFLAYLTARRVEHPGMHVYHYAAYERTALLRLAGRHGAGEDAIDQLLREGVLVDLYATVRAGLRVGQESYSLKKLEPLYLLGDERRSGEVTNAAASVVAYAEACESRDAGDDEAWQRQIADIAEYNRDDVVSTLRLRDWLRAQAAERAVEASGGQPGDGAQDGDQGEDPEPASDDPAPEDDPIALALLGYADDTTARSPEHQATRTADQQAGAMLAASLGYFWRERKPYWWAHFDRLVSDPAEWMDQRNTFHVEEATVLEEWHRAPRARTSRRTLELIGTLEPGSDLRVGSTQCVAIYEPPVPEGAATSVNAPRAWTSTGEVLEVGQASDGERTRLVLSDRLRGDMPEHDAVPIALTPGGPPATTSIEQALANLAGQVAEGLPTLPGHPALDLLRRIPPRTATPDVAPTVGDPSAGTGLPQPASPEATADAIVAALRILDHSYLAVQGPPGTGKTFTGARVIARLVAEGWTIGVVAQSHEVVENMLRGVLDAGVDPPRIGKKPPAGSTEPRPWRLLRTDGDVTAFWASHSGQGLVMGGTAWDLTNPKRLSARPLDLVVVDEAGQFSLAQTLAVSTAGARLLLLGDPQQLPQVSQGTHPEPVDRSALGWLMEGHETLPDELGYFLPQTWRMHPDLCRVVSRLSYGGRLSAVPRTADRMLDGVAPGVRVVRVAHEGHAVMSPEEAATVVALVRDVVSRRWRDPAEGVDRALEPADVLVVAAYNAQVWAVRAALEKAGLSAVRVGTVDKFQGKQAPVVIVTTAASSPDDVPRGMEFLLNRNRINVAISRAQWCAIVVRAEGLTDYLPATPAGLGELWAFLGLG